MGSAIRLYWPLLDIRSDFCGWVGAGIDLQENSFTRSMTLLGNLGEQTTFSVIGNNLIYTLPNLYWGVGKRPDRFDTAHPSLIDLQ